MKKIFLALLLLPTIAYSQLEKANTILIKNVSFEEVANKVLDAGYRFEKKDDKYYTIKTEPLSFGSLSIYLDIRVKDSICYLIGYMFLNAMADPFRIENRGMKKSLLRITFKEINDFALLFNKEISYEKN